MNDVFYMTNNYIYVMWFIGLMHYLPKLLSSEVTVARILDVVAFPFDWPISRVSGFCKAIINKFNKKEKV